MKNLNRVVEMMKCLLFALLLSFNPTLIFVHAQDQSGFISIDCGIAEGSEYTDGTSGINYTSDKGFIDSGLNMKIQEGYNTPDIEKQFSTVRSFPQGTRNCYALKTPQGKNHTYLIRARFMYGNYDLKSQPPTFDLHLGVDPWDTLILKDTSTQVKREIIHLPTSSDYINVCLVKTGPGTPFISTLELRLLGDTMYKMNHGSLQLFSRSNLDSTLTTYQIVRYNDDKYDRIWKPWNLTNATTISSSLNVVNDVMDIPSSVMRSGSVPQNASDPLYFYWETSNSSDQFYFHLYFAEVELLQPNQSREFETYINGELWNKAFVLHYLRTHTFYTEPPLSGYFKYEFTLQKTKNSTLPPILNALEIFTVKKFSNLETDEKDVAAIWRIKSTYGLSTRNSWQGDPCAPQAFVWDGLNCSYDAPAPPRIISLNLSSSGLTGHISPYIADLTMIQTLDLSKNNLTGKVPDFLSQLDSLSVLYLKGNNFSGSIPVELLSRSKEGSLDLSIDGVDENIGPSQTLPCNKEEEEKKKKKKNKFIIPVVASLAALSAFFMLFCILWKIKKKLVKKLDAKSNQKAGGSLYQKNRQFTYSEIEGFTNNFQRVIGKGGFGTVYHGYIGDTQVAVKMLSPSSIQGYKEFQAEANLLMSVHHKNLTSLVGYCNEGNNMGIIYEYMANGNLGGYLSGRHPHVLSWSDRLQIARDAAQGLAYLHHGCKAPIIHRDIKSTNILLNDKFQAKLADFGLSRFFPMESGTHLSTTVAGTPGYLDPACYTSNRLTEKSDVYSFGIVLLEIITGRPAIAKNHDKNHIAQWVDSILEKGDVRNIVDPRLRGDFEVNSLWKVVELAMDCVSPTSTKRPTMNQVVMELQHLETDIVFRGTGSTKLLSMNLESEFNPVAR